MNLLLATLLYIGCSTDAAHANGLHQVEMDLESGALTLLSSTVLPQAVYQAQTRDGSLLFSCTKGGVVALRPERGAFREVARVRTEGTPCHISLAPDEKTVYWADYGKGRAGALAWDGATLLPRDVFTHEGSGPNVPRQAKPHCHQALPTPDGKGFVVVDLGLDALVTYRDGRRVQSFTTLPRGAGPRHLVFDPSGRMAFVLFELGNLLASVAWTPETGFGPMLDNCPTLANWPTSGRAECDAAAAIRFTPDGRRLVVSNRGEESLTTFDFNRATGQLSLVAHSPLPGSWPRDFDFVSPTRALVTMERSGDIHSLAYDPATGRFSVLKTLGGFYRPLSVNQAVSPAVSSSGTVAPSASAR